MQGGKLELYSKIKNHFQYEEYLNIIKSKSRRASLTRLRISNHSLQIERGRYVIPKLPRSERLCSSCLKSGSSAVEDELHFLFDCPIYADLRVNLLSSIPTQLLDQSVPKINLYFYLVNSEGKTIINLSTFCEDGFKRKVDSLTT